MPSHVCICLSPYFGSQHNDIVEFPLLHKSDFCPKLLILFVIFLTPNYILPVPVKSIRESQCFYTSLMSTSFSPPTYIGIAFPPPFSLKVLPPQSLVRGAGCIVLDVESFTHDVRKCWISISEILHCDISCQRPIA